MNHIMGKNAKKYHRIKNDFKGVLLQKTTLRSNSISKLCNKCCSVANCQWALRTIGCIVIFYIFSISLTFYNQRFIHYFRFPLSITMTHLITKFVLSAVIRWFCFCKTGKERVTLSWIEYIKRVAPPGITSSLDIGLSNWSFEYITISLYTMTKTTCIVFILLFSILFRLEKPRVSLIFVVLFIAIGLFMFTYESTQFHLLGFLLVLTASFISGLRWTLSQIVLQRKDIGLTNPVDMMFHIQPWMILSLVPLSTGFEGMNLATSEHAFGFHDGHLMAQNMCILFAGALLAFLLELSEFMVVSTSSGLTLSIAGIFKEVIILLMAAFINGDTMNVMNACGLAMCLLGIGFHILLKAIYVNESNTTSDSSPKLSVIDEDELANESDNEELGRFIVRKR